jgi:hypothetical protein
MLHISSQGSNGSFEVEESETQSPHCFLLSPRCLDYLLGARFFFLARSSRPQEMLLQKFMLSDRCLRMIRLDTARGTPVSRAQDIACFGWRG